MTFSTLALSPVVALCLFAGAIGSPHHTDLAGGGRTVVVIMMPQGGGTGPCAGCAESVEVTVDSPAASCPNGTLGATIAHTDETSGGGKCESLWWNKPCTITGGCWAKKKITILIAQPPCIAFYVEGPGITGRTALANTIDLGHFTDQAPCSNDGDKEGAGLTFRLYDAATGGNLLASYGWKVKCSQCTRSPS